MIVPNCISLPSLGELLDKFTPLVTEFWAQHGVDYLINIEPVDSEGNPISRNHSLGSPGTLILKIDGRFRIEIYKKFWSSSFYEDHEIKKLVGDFFKVRRKYKTPNDIADVYWFVDSYIPGFEDELMRASLAILSEGIYTVDKYVYDERPNLTDYDVKTGEMITAELFDKHSAKFFNIASVKTARGFE